ncbi:MAG: hypothetical protein RLZZ342_45 [Candidatus Parcubacteria bacterium]|jgi:hypothetical protein
METSRRVGGLARWGDYVLDAALRRLALMWRHVDIFVGGTLFAIGVLGFESGKYCDGNTADYLSCTRPAVYYYYSAFDIVLVVVGIWFITVWCVRGMRE